MDTNANWVLPFGSNYTPFQFNKISILLYPNAPVGPGYILQLSNLTTPSDYFLGRIALGFAASHDGGGCWKTRSFARTRNL